MSRHILNVELPETYEACGDCPEDCDCWESWIELSVASDDCDGQCLMWYECSNMACMPTEDEEDDGEYFRHGKNHREIEGSWMIESTDCGATEACDDMWEIARTYGPGKHLVSVEYWGDGCWEMTYDGPLEGTETIL